jgi:hypothetical protein
LKVSANEVSREAEKVSTQRKTLLNQARVESEAALELRRELQSDEVKALQGASISGPCVVLAFVEELEGCWTGSA